MESLCNICQLCRSEKAMMPVSGIDKRVYYQCENCHLISVDQKHLLDKASEKARYATHQNGIQHEGYVEFLSQAIEPALEFIAKEMTGLDYGCGPGPTLSVLLERAGYSCEDFDPFFVKHELNKKFGFIFSTEVFEHFFYPKKDIQRIHALLEDEGILIVMTDRWSNLKDFSSWSYPNDSCHVCFYHTKTFSYICEQFGFKIVFDDGQKVIVLKKIKRMGVKNDLY